MKLLSSTLEGTSCEIRTICTSVSPPAEFSPTLPFSSFVHHPLFIHVIMNHQRHNNIRNGIVWVQTGHNTCTCTVTQHVIGPRTHQKFESSKKVRNDENRIRICYSIPKKFEIVRINFRLHGKPNNSWHGMRFHKDDG